MKTFLKSVKTIVFDTVVGGLIFLIPLFVVLAVGQKIKTFSENLGSNIAKWLGLDYLSNVFSSSAFSIAIVLLICFLFGLLARTTMAKWLRKWFEAGLKRFIPTYEYYQTLIEQKLKLSSKPPRPVLLVRSSGGWRPGIVIEEYPNGEKVLFLPLSPKTSDGEVVLVKSEETRESGLNENTLNAVLLKQGQGLMPR